jgi:hypothetical protein
MKVFRPTLLVLVAALAVLGSTRVQAQAHNVAMVYRFTPAAGKSAAFEKALGSHAAWRKQAGDPWSWEVYQVLTGEHAGSYMIRSGGHTWADLDAYDAGFGPKGTARFQADVQPLVGSWTSWVTVGDTAHQRLPQSAEGYTMVTLSFYSLKPGEDDQFDAAVDAIQKAIVKQNAPFHYAWFSPMDSGPGGVRGLAIFNENWAGFQPQRPNLGQIMNQEYGEAMAGQIRDEFTDSYSHVVSQIMRLRPDLSVMHEGS